MNLEFTTEIASAILKGLILDSTNNEDTFVEDVSKIKFDLNESGHYLSSKKTIKVLDTSGTTYTITLEVDND